MKSPTMARRVKEWRLRTAWETLTVQERQYVHKRVIEAEMQGIEVTVKHAGQIVEVI